jgi:hypothetical protein
LFSFRILLKKNRWPWRRQRQQHIYVIFYNLCITKINLFHVLQCCLLHFMTSFLLLNLLVVPMTVWYGSGGALVEASSSRFPTHAPTVSLNPSAAPTRAPSNLRTQVEEVNFFHYSGMEDSFIVPDGAESLRVFMWGAGGSWGGNGAYVEGVLPVSAGQRVAVIVGQQGINGGPSAFGGGGPASNYGGGGRSAIRIDNEDVVTAGGGGGSFFNYGGHATSFKNGAIQNVSYRGFNDAMTVEVGSDGGGGGGAASLKAVKRIRVLNLGRSIREEVVIAVVVVAIMVEGAENFGLEGAAPPICTISSHTTCRTRLLLRVYVQECTLNMPVCVQIVVGLAIKTVAW